MVCLALTTLDDSRDSVMAARDKWRWLFEG